MSEGLARNCKGLSPRLGDCLTHGVLAGQAAPGQSPAVTFSVLSSQLGAPGSARVGRSRLSLVAHPGFTGLQSEGDSLPGLAGWGWHWWEVHCVPGGWVSAHARR